jgi:hypothetical protein
MIIEIIQSILLLLVAIAVVSYVHHLRKGDPLHSCDVYKKEGCAHVDGYLCDMKTCIILKDHLDKLKETK